MMSTQNRLLPISLSKDGAATTLRQNSTTAYDERYLQLTPVMNTSKV